MIKFLQFIFYAMLTRCKNQENYSEMKSTVPSI